MIELLKTLVDEPEKINKILIKLLKASLAGILSIYLYDNILNASSIEQLSDPTQWLALYRDGNVILGVFIYLISYIILFNFLPILTNGIFPLCKRIARKLIKSSDNGMWKAIGVYLRFFKVIHRPIENKRGKAGKNFDKFYEIFKEVLRKDIISEMSSFNHSLVNNIFNIFSAFLFLYYFILPIKVDSTYLSICISIFAFFGIIIYVSIGLFVDYISKHTKDMKYLLKWLKTEELIFQTFNELGVQIQESQNHLVVGYEDFFFLNDKEYILVFAYSNPPLAVALIENCKGIIEKYTDKELLLLSNKELSSDAEEYFKKSENGRLHFIHFKKMSDLRQKLIALIFNR